MNQGWISLHRKLLDNELFKSRSPAGLKLWIAVLLSATHQTKEITRSDGTKVTLEPGDFYFGRNTWAKWLRMPPRTVRRWLAAVQSSGQVKPKIVDNLTPSIYSVVNWKKYQEGKEAANPQQNQRPDKWPRNNNVYNNKREVFPKREEEEYRNLIRKEVYGQS